MLLYINITHYLFKITIKNNKTDLYSLQKRSALRFLSFMKVNNQQIYFMFRLFKCNIVDFNKNNDYNLTTLFKIIFFIKRNYSFCKIHVFQRH